MAIPWTALRTPRARGSDAVLNVAVFLWPQRLPFGVRLFDVAGVAATAALGIAFTASAVRNATRLRDEETQPAP